MQEPTKNSKNPAQLESGPAPRLFSHPRSAQEGLVSFRKKFEQRRFHIQMMNCYVIQTQLTMRQAEMVSHDVVYEDFARDGV
jgi:hypothetical protein